MVPAGNRTEAELVDGIDVVAVSSVRHAMAAHGADIEVGEVEPLPAPDADTDAPGAERRRHPLGPVGPGRRRLFAVFGLVDQLRGAQCQQRQGQHGGELQQPEQAPHPIVGHQGEGSITDIAVASGFSSANAFRIAYSKSFGIAPSSRFKARQT